MKRLQGLALFVTHLLVLCIAACSSGETFCLDCQDAGETNSLELVVDFKLDQGQVAHPPMYVYGRYFASGHDIEAERKPFKCQTTLVADTTRLTCSVGIVPFSQEVRFMVAVPQSDGTVIPACKTADSCIGQVLVYSPSQPAFHGDATNLVLVQDALFVDGFAYRMYVPRPNL